jgi:hypothetical protein
MAVEMLRSFIDRNKLGFMYFLSNEILVNHGNLDNLIN